MSYSYLHDVDQGGYNHRIQEYPSVEIPNLTTSNKSTIGHSVAPSLPDTSLDNASIDAIPSNSDNYLLIISSLIFSLLVGVVFIVVGLIVHKNSKSWRSDELPDWRPGTERNIIVSINYSGNLALSLLLNVLVTFCIEFTGYAHGMALKWGLAEEGRLRFNTNSRLFTTTQGTFSINGPAANTLFGISIVLSYASCNSIFLRFGIPTDTGDRHYYTVISFVPPVVFGSTLIIQSVLGMIAFRDRRILTWSNNPLDVASALVYHDYLQHQPSRCMRSVITPTAESGWVSATRPSSTQPSLLVSHGTVRHMVGLVWAVAAAGFLFGGILLACDGGAVHWRDKIAPPGPLLWGLLLVAVIQSAVTVALHCCEVVMAFVRDEVVWRAASSQRGARLAVTPMELVLGSWQSCGVLFCKPAMHWFFGIAVSLEPGWGWTTDGISMLMFASSLVLLASFVTIVATRRPRGPQPAAYGSLQTLADLIDEWSETMYWGHKADGVGPLPVSHAGTTGDGPLPPIRMSAYYE
ncbi:hypothetical protein FRB95_005190 [Tulasnella sp. JGI-2019a]|nr:hypothetical protein FRB95_005190 [Tulasnella sp. JGI-2019a]